MSVATGADYLCCGMSAYSRSRDVAPMCMCVTEILSMAAASYIRRTERPEKGHWIASSPAQYVGFVRHERFVDVFGVV